MHVTLPYFDVDVSDAQGHISIHHDTYGELIYWHQREWEEEPELVFLIADLIKQAYTDPTSLLRDLGKE